MVSPKDDVQTKPTSPYAPMNGAIRVGFYQGNNIIYIFNIFYDSIHQRVFLFAQIPQQKAAQKKVAVHVNNHLHHRIQIMLNICMFRQQHQEARIYIAI